MSPRGHPDYLNNAGTISVGSIDTDNIFLALAGISLLDNRGKLIILDTFKDGLLNYGLTKSGDGELAVVKCDNPLLPGGSLYFYMGASAASGTSIAQRFCYIGQPNRVGFEVAVVINTDMPHIRLAACYNNNGIFYACNMYLTPPDFNLKIETVDGLVAVYDFSSVLGLTAYHPIKIVADFVTGKYDRLVVGTTQIDLRSYSMVPVTGLTPGILNIILGGEAVASSNNLLRIGYVTITIDEP